MLTAAVTPAMPPPLLFVSQLSLNWSLELISFDLQDSDCCLLAVARIRLRGLARDVSHRRANRDSGEREGSRSSHICERVVMLECERLRSQSPEEEFCLHKE